MEHTGVQELASLHLNAVDLRHAIHLGRFGEVRLDGALLRLSRREFALLEALLERPGTVLSKEQLEQHLYGWQDEVTSNAIEVHLHHLRRKLGADWIRNVRGVGYMAVEPA